MVSVRRALLALGTVTVVASALTAASGASWREERPVGAGTLAAGRLDLRAGGAHAHAFSALSGSNLGPGSYRQAPLAIANVGDVALRYRLSGVALGGLAGSATYSVTRVASAGACPSVGTPTAVAGDATSFRTLAPTASETWCLRVTLGSNPPQALTGSTVVFTYAGEQARHAR